jgi:hypothetical protein
MAKKITQAQKIRDYAAKRPNATIADIAHSMGIRYQAVYAVLRPNGKTPKKIIITATQAALANRLGISTKEYAEQIHKLTKGRKRVRPIMVNMTQHADGSITEQVTEVTKALWQPPAMVPMPEPTTDNVNEPTHYKIGGIETIDFIEAKSLNFHLGNVVKYVVRADHKGDREQDLLKARWYLNREIAKFTKEA